MGYPTKRSVPVCILSGTVISVLVTVVCAGVVSALIHRELLSENSVGYAALVLLMVSAYLGALMACKSGQGIKLMISAVSGLSYFLLLIGMTALFFEGKYTGIGVTAMVIFCGAALAAFPKKEHKRVGKRHKIKITTR